MIELTEDETALIQQRRKDQARRAADEAFQLKAIATAHAFATWSIATGEGLTFSTFTNTFGYQEDDGKLMYEALKRIHDVAWPNARVET